MAYRNIPHTDVDVRYHCGGFGPARAGDFGEYNMTIWHAGSTDLFVFTSSWLHRLTPVLASDYPLQFGRVGYRLSQVFGDKTYSNLNVFVNGNTNGGYKLADHPSDNNQHYDTDTTGYYSSNSKSVVFRSNMLSNGLGIWGDPNEYGMSFKGVYADKDFTQLIKATASPTSTYPQLVNLDWDTQVGTRERFYCQFGPAV